uniref:Spore protein YkvP/CgeB glycosyl transferase-like domain-containing protein n=1 Tax=viral metagenome TaxID=1070528 RepID=A0A6C0BMJ5_9ZZZZ
MTTNLRPTLLIIGYYHLADGFRACANFLRRDYDIFFFPLSHYRDHQYDIKTDLIRYVKGECCSHYECGMQEHQPPMDIVLFWNFRYFIESHEGLDVLVQMKSVITRPTVYLGYNWDPIPPLEDPEQSGDFRIPWIQLLNGYLTCDGCEIRYLRDKGYYNYVYCPPGFDPAITYYISDPLHACDVSIVCTNLYADYTHFIRKMVRVHRKELVDLLYAHREELNFHIYGPPQLNQLYPACYRGLITYEECPQVFSNSKINLCIHATSYNNYQKYLYYSERLPQILGARGLAYCETEYDGLLIPGVHYVLADATDPLGQIKEIIRTYDFPKYRTIREKGYELAQKSLTWDTMRQKINLITHMGHTVSTSSQPKHRR